MPDGAPACTWESLPPELWLLILRCLDDHCFTWFIIRRVSPNLRRLAESAFAPLLLQNLTIRVTGEPVGDLLPLTRYNILFRPTRFFPPETRETIVLKVYEHPTDYRYESTFRFRRYCCFCPARVNKPEDVLHCNCLAVVFFAQDEIRRNRVFAVRHYVRLQDSLRSIKVPVVSSDPEEQEFTVHWRLLCSRFFSEELRTRRVHHAHSPQEILNGCPRDRWIFWDLSRDEQTTTTTIMPSNFTTSIFGE